MFNLFLSFVCVLSRFSGVQLVLILWTMACQTLMSVGFSWQEYWNGLPCDALADLPDSGIKLTSFISPALAGRFFTTGATGKPHSYHCCCCCKVTSVVSDSVRPHRPQPTRLPRPWDSPGKNTGAGCHFLLQCMKVESESEVAQPCLTVGPHRRQPTRLSRPWDSPGKSTDWGAIAFFLSVSANK